MTDAPRAQAPRVSGAPQPEGVSAAPAEARSKVDEYEFSEVHKEGLAALAASTSFVGVCVMLLGLMSAVFALAAAYGGYVPVGIALMAGAAVCFPLGWWATAAGRSLSAMVRTRGRDVVYLMDAVAQLRRLFGFARVFIIVYALAAAAAAAGFVWCNFVSDKGGRCFAAWW